MMPNKCNINQSKIISYSERGIMDAIVFTIGQSTGKVTEFLRDCLKVNILKSYDDVSSYDLYLEHSLSEFGTPDLVIIVHYKDQSSDVIFIEAKVCSNTMNWSLERMHKDYVSKKGKGSIKTSNLFFQLYLKRLLFKNKDTDLKNVADVNKHFRSIGENKVVKIFKDKIIACKNDYYIAFVPSAEGSYQYSDFSDNSDSFKIHFVEWKTIEQFFVNVKHEAFIGEVFKYNGDLIYKRR